MDHLSKVYRVTVWIVESAVAYKSCKETKRGEATFQGPTNELLCHTDGDEDDLDNQKGDNDNMIIIAVILFKLPIMIMIVTMMMIGTIYFHIMLLLILDVGQSNFCRP